MKQALKKIIFKFLGKKIKQYRHFNDTIGIMRGSIVESDNVIGDYTYIGYNCVLTRSIVGRYCSIGNNVSIGLGEHKLKRISTSTLFYKTPYETITEKECRIGNDVWIGSNAVIRRGISIGDGAVIGANSFVNADVEPYAVVAGSPARFIRKRLDDESIGLIIASQWWMKDLETAKKILAELSASGRFEIDE